MPLHRIAERRIEEAMSRGEFENLSGKGSPLKPDEVDRLPREMRMAYIILKNSGFIEKDRVNGAATPESLLNSCSGLEEGSVLVQRDKKLNFLSRKMKLKIPGESYTKKLLGKIMGTTLP